MSDSKNDIAWKKLFEKYRIAETVTQQGFFEITSASINKFREARLMTKFDYKSQLPAVFAEHHLAVLPDSRRSYRIASFEAYKNFENGHPEIRRIPFPSFIESIDYNNITGESAALNCAFITGMIHDFTGEAELKPTVSGRMSSSSFDFDIETRQGLQRVAVNNSQIEIDGGYEGRDALILIEAKNAISKDFLIRQLYYPYRLWSAKLRKKVRPLFLTYSNGVFHFREYEFREPRLYNSLVLVREKKYAVSEGVITAEKIKSIAQTVECRPEPAIAFPQADSFERVVNLCELLYEKSVSDRVYITENYDFDVRQTNYYTDAARYLGLIEKKHDKGKVLYFLSEYGAALFTKSLYERQLAFIERILSHRVFNETLKLYSAIGTEPAKTEVSAIMKQSELYKVNAESTFLRRASTVSGWVKWILSRVEE